MNRDIWAGQWKQLKGKLRQQWGKLTDDDMDRIQGDYEMLIGRLQELYGKSREDVENDLAQGFVEPERPLRKAS